MQAMKPSPHAPNKTGRSLGMRLTNTCRLDVCCTFRNEMDIISLDAESVHVHVIAEMP